MRFIRFALVAIVSYICAAMLSSHVSIDLAETNWSSLWTYFWWAIGIPAVVALGAVSGFVAAAVVAFIRNW